MTPLNRFFSKPKPQLFAALGGEERMPRLEVSESASLNINTRNFSGKRLSRKSVSPMAQTQTVKSASREKSNNIKKRTPF